MTTTETTPAERRVRVTYEPLPGHRPWRAIIPAVENEAVKIPAVPVGRFDTPAAAGTAGVSALRFVEAGVRWVPVDEGEVPA